MTEEISFTMPELLGRINDSWQALQGLLDGLDDDALTAKDPDSGWAIVDHLNHIAAWERGVAYLLGGKPRTEGMGVTAEQWRDLTMDEINDVVVEQGRRRTTAETLAYSHAAHAEMVAILNKLDEADLRRDYASYDAGGDFPGRPIIGWVVGDTYEHYDEHAGYIREKLGR